MAVTTAIIAGAASVGSAVVDTVSKYQNEKAQENVHGYNELVARDDAQRTLAEYAMNAGLLRANARKQIATAENQMGAMGNFGSSSDAAIVDAYLNLSSDLAAMKYQYDNTAIKFLNEAENHKYNKAISRVNKKGALLGGLLNITGAVAQGYAGYSMAGGKYGYKVSGNGFTNAIGAQQKVAGAGVDYMQAASAAGLLG